MAGGGVSKGVCVSPEKNGSTFVGKGREWDVLYRSLWKHGVTNSYRRKTTQIPHDSDDLASASGMFHPERQLNSRLYRSENSAVAFLNNW